MKHFDMLYKIADATVPVGGQRLAACIVSKKRLISVGFNKKKTHPLQWRFSKHEEAVYLHAEIDAIINAKENNLRDATMYVLRVMKNGNTGLAKPCKGCERALKHFGIKKVYYTR